MKKLAIAVIAAGMLSATTALAAGSQAYQKVATVYKVTPFVTTKTVSTPNRVCTEVDVPIYKRTKGGDDLGSIIIGGVIGSVIGNKVSGANGAGTVGAVIGGVLGNEHSKNKNSDTEIIGYERVNQCKTTYTNQQEQYVQHYTVYVDYNGMHVQFNTKKEFNIGDEVIVKVNVHVVH